MNRRINTLNLYRETLILFVVVVGVVGCARFFVFCIFFTDFFYIYFYFGSIVWLTSAHTYKNDQNENKYKFLIIILYVM